jgi:hypothetical protein
VDRPDCAAIIVLLQITDVELAGVQSRRIERNPDIGGGPLRSTPSTSGAALYWRRLMTARTKVVASDVEEYQRFVLDKLAKLPGISTYRSTLIMRVVKQTTVLPV